MRYTMAAVHAAMIQNANNNPSAINIDHLPIKNGVTIAQAIAAPNAHFKRVHRSGRVALRHEEIGPIAIKNRAGAINGKNTASK